MTQLHERQALSLVNIKLGWVCVLVLFIISVKSAMFKRSEEMNSFIGIAFSYNSIRSKPHFLNFFYSVSIPLGVFFVLNSFVGIAFSLQINSTQTTFPKFFFTACRYHLKYIFVCSFIGIAISLHFNSKQTAFCKCLTACWYHLECIFVCNRKNIMTKIFFQDNCDFYHCE